MPILGIVFAAALAAAQVPASPLRPALGVAIASADTSGVVAASEPAAGDTLRPIEAISLESLLSNDVRGGEMGAYGVRLAEYQAKSELHGYISADMNGSTRDKTSTYDLHHAVLIAQSNFFDRIVPEMAIEWEHMGTVQYVAYAQVDLKSSDALIFRVGQFVAPVGAFNEYQYADFLRKTVLSPIAMTVVIPSLWSEVGAQLRGKLVNASGQGINYALFSSNGLEQPDTSRGVGPASEGGNIRTMRMHARDLHNANKAFGGRVGVEAGQGIEMGFSGYSGAYTADGRRNLTLLDSDLTLQNDRLTLRFEIAEALQEIAGGRLEKRGGYALVAVHATPALEPYLQLESADLEGQADPVRRRVIGGAVYYPFPEQAKNVMVKVEGAWTRLGHQDPFGQFLSELTLGF